MTINWKRLENRLFSLVAEDIRTFGAAHGDETFYGFGLDCNSDYGQVLLCLNTPESLRQRAVQYATDRSAREPTTPAQEEQKLRWNFGDWKYQGFNSERFDASWEEFDSAVSDTSDEEEKDEETFMTPTQDHFMRAACRVVIRLESAGVFDVLKRTPDFAVYVADHDESKEKSWARLEAVRKEEKGK